MGYAEDTKRMQVFSLHPGVTLEQVRANTGFELAVAEPLLTTSPPTEAELMILREEVDPFGYVIGRGGK
jgi:glutaconate CoA-transferase subunit B